MSNADIVNTLYAAYGRGDIEAVVAGLSPDVTWHEHGRLEDFPAFGPRKGHAEVREVLGLFRSELEFEAFTPLEVHAVADRVFVLGHTAARLRRNGRRVETDWVHVFGLRDGKVTSFAEFADTAQVAEAWRA